MRTSESIAKIAPALLAAQREAEAPRKTSRNPHFNSTYAGLPEVRDALIPALQNHGISVVQEPSFLNGGIASVTTRLVHDSGEWIEIDSAAPVAKQDAQGWRSTITYVRRTVYESIGALAAEDDDGNAGSQQTRRATPTRETPKGVQVTSPAAANPSAFLKRARLTQKQIDRLLEQTHNKSHDVLLRAVFIATGKRPDSTMAKHWPELDAEQYDKILKAIKPIELPEPVVELEAIDKLRDEIEALCADNSIMVMTRTKILSEYQNLTEAEATPKRLKDMIQMLKAVRG